MIKKERNRVNILVSSIIFIGFVLLVMVNYRSYSKIIKDDIENISKLTSTNIYSEINNELIKPIFVSLTMANDNFLKEWFREEVEKVDSKEHLQLLEDYLVGIEIKYDYNSVFLVSNLTDNYYHYKGIFKTVSPDNDHDQWYYNFLKTGKVYALDVDQDEADENKLTVFVNCRMEDEDQNLLGVAGVGLELDQVQLTLKKFESDYGLEAFLMDKEGVIQIHTDTQYIENRNVFEQGSLGDYKDKILNNLSGLESIQVDDSDFNGYYITRYIDELEWFLVVKKDTSILQKSLTSHLLEDIIIMTIVIIFLLLIVNSLVKNHSKMITKMAVTDQLTELPNRRGFDQSLVSALNNYSLVEDGACVFVFDIDDFKRVNDVKGHVLGDRVIKLIAEYAKRLIGEHGMVARWGGDEFSGIIYGDIDKATVIAARLVEKMREEKEFKELNITISLGLTQIHKLDTIEEIIARADKGLYMAKTAEKDQYFVV